MNDPLFRATTPAPVVTTHQPVCPFHDGPETLDLLLAEVPAAESTLIDLALELRKAMTDGHDAEYCLHLLFALRTALDGRHHLSFYRVRRWLQRRIVGAVRLDRGSAWQPCDLPLDCARFDELVNRCIAAALEGDSSWPQTAVFRPQFADTAPLD